MIHFSNYRAFLKMNFRKSITLLIILVIFMAIFDHGCRVEASRVLSEDFASSNHLDTYSSIYEKAKRNMAFWLERLPSGPSPGGGH
ncbi:hypothetical protein FH972_015251 [Carpinus fangiana]|uniref:Transmembrane protein n=1 Tax=Carpinus fangiana TaxID=176857 RepID=A0A5N6RDA1_9ROSI|nr:hypothetical protein FH972_015251 [Carpinus fangiana]